jgi:PAS domain-containing protein
LCSIFATGAVPSFGDRMRDLANASVEGLLVCDGETIVSINTSFATLTGLSVSDLVGARLES